MSLATFNFSKNNTLIEITGEEFDINTLNTFLDLLIKIDNNNTKNIKIIGNFNSKLLLDTSIFNKDASKIDEILNLFQSISRTIEESKTLFTSEINGLVQGPAMEIALLCNFIKANKDTTLKLDQTNYGFMPFFGTTQRLTRLIGYQDTLKAFFIDKKLTFNQGLKLDLFNHTIDNFTKIKNKKIFWDQTFTNTFIFYNSKIHSTFKNQKPEYSAILSTIFESSVCQYDAGLSIEKRWVKWLIKHKLFNSASGI